MSLSPERLDRFARHIVLPEIGGAGQVALAGKHLVLVGQGELGSKVAGLAENVDAMWKAFAELPPDLRLELET